MAPRDLSEGVERDIERLYRDSAPQLWRAIEIRDPLPWIYRTAFRIASRELQRERRGPPATPDRVPGIDPLEVQEVLSALWTLSPNQRAAVLLHDQERFTAPEVGRLIGVSAATVRVHLFRARGRLREVLGGEEDRDD